MLLQTNASAQADDTHAARASDQPRAAVRAGADVSGGLEALGRFVREHQVCWETTRRVQQQRDGRRVAVGFRITLYARHARGLASDPGSDLSRGVQLGLRALAAATAEPAPTGVACRFVPEPSRLVLRPESDWAPEMMAHLDVLHDTATFGEPSERQQACVRQIEARLAEIGARHGRWRRR